MGTADDTLLPATWYAEPGCVDAEPNKELVGFAADELNSDGAEEGAACPKRPPVFEPNNPPAVGLDPKSPPADWFPKGEAVDVDAPKAPKLEVDGLAPKRFVEVVDTEGCVLLPNVNGFDEDVAVLKAGPLKSDELWVPKPVVDLVPNNPVLVWVCPNGDVVEEEPNSPPVAGLLPKIDVAVVGVPNSKDEVVVVAPKPVEELPNSGLLCPKTEDCAVVVLEPNNEEDGCEVWPNTKPPLWGPFLFAK